IKRHREAASYPRTACDWPARPGRRRPRRPVSPSNAGAKPPRGPLPCRNRPTAGVWCPGAGPPRAWCRPTPRSARDAGVEPQFGLDPDIVRRIIEAPMPLGARGLDPSGADHDQDSPGFPERVTDHLGEWPPRGYAAEFSEDSGRGEVSPKTIVHATDGL